jgi:A/G-specific adenine glycosylase
LLRWYRRHRRDLPWRRTADPYRVWVAEVMLQQTRVATVLPYYDRFIGRFPDAATLARASEEEVLSLWSGLGYYRRAQSLRAGARVVVERHGGKLPADPEALLRLPGVGRYTAGAISSIAFDLPEPVVDGNVRRVLVRLLGLRTRAGRRSDENRLWDYAAALARGPDPGDLNQALMELGARICVARKPRCPACPLARGCRAAATGEPTRFPVPRPARPRERVRVLVACVTRGRRVLLERPGRGNPLRGAWDLPALEVGPRTPVGRIGAELSRRHGLEVELVAMLGRADHAIMHRQLRLEIHACRVRRGGVTGRPALRWADPRCLGDVPVSGATRKVLRRAAPRRRAGSAA